MKDNTFWLRIFQTIAGFLAVIVMSIGGCTAYESKRIADAIAGGADPIDARCGISGTSISGTTICTVRAAQPSRGR